MKRTLIVGDTHGMLQELNELVRAANYDPYTDRLIFVGDFLDRGPDSVGCVRRARELGAECVLGNHEAKYIRFKSHQERIEQDRHYKNPMRFDAAKTAIYEGLTDADWAYMKAAPPYIKLHDGKKDVYVAHAGFQPFLPIETQNPKFMTMIRYVDERGNFASNGTPFKPEGNVKPWNEVWCREENVVYGHQIWSTDKPHINENELDGKCYSIDQGCVYGFSLTMLILPTYEFVQVKAHKAYSTLH